MSDPDAPISENTFLVQLIGDVIDTNARLGSHDTPGHRRDAVRTTFAAIEGSIWLLREHVRSVAKGMDVLSPVADMALRETSYSVDRQGHIIEQTKFIALPTILRLAVVQAHHIDDRLDIDFGDQGWEIFRDAIAIRNRVTHPKVALDLAISDTNLETIRRALFWLLFVVQAIMAKTTIEFAAHARMTRTLLDALRRGETWALELYHRELNRPDPDT